ncbi:MAG: 3-deoxy-8-phosphooctulonate synthase [Candidatus Eisenbacteria bacterium]|nr:3-deoxy-8-phosphooctulonate synthase [Candidatus Eisenbacteria bacterium]
MPQRTVRIGDVEVGAGRGLALIAGPCAIESEELTLGVAEALVRIAADLGVPLVFKSSYLKDNRMSPGAFAGPGLEEGLRILERVKREFGVPVISDVHEREEVGHAARVLDALQIPAFLCRQTRLLEAACATGLPLNIKKGQFMAPEDMRHIVAKAAAAGSHRVMLTERGASFGYHDLVVDMRSIGTMRGFGCPVVFDATHSVQRPGSAGGTSGGSPEFVPLLARAACAAGCDALFVETHPDPSSALSDALSMVPLSELPGVLEGAVAVAKAVRQGKGLGA